MKLHHNNFDHLRSELPPLRPDFKRALGQRLLVQAREQMQVPRSSRLQTLHNLYIQMKRNFYIPLSTAVLLVVAGTLFFRPLNPEKILAQAAELYQGQGLYHEKILTRELSHGTLLQSSLDEYWRDDVGNSLTLSRDPFTEEILDINLSTLNEYGDGWDYASKSLEQGFDEGPSESQKAWLAVYEGEKDFCIKTIVEEGQLVQSVLALAKEDYTHYTVSGGMGEVETTSTTLTLIEQLQAEPNFYSVRQEVENGEKFVVFFHRFNDQGADSTESYYFDATTYELKKTVNEFSAGSSTEQIYLISEYDQTQDPGLIFDPEQYASYDLKAFPMLLVGTPFDSWGLTDSGCYNHLGEEYSKAESAAILEEVPAEAIEQWELNFDAMQEDQLAEASDPVFDDGEAPDGEVDDGEVEITEQQKEWLRPASTSISQAYNPGHAALDFQSDGQENVPIVAIADATVRVVSNDGRWNAGRGNMIILDHGDGIESLYAHLGDILVEEGQTVTAGQQIAVMGNTGRVKGGSGIHLHFEINDKGQKMNPMLYLED